MALAANQRGDTIIEVMIALLIMAVVLTGAFVTANSSLKNDNAAEQHTVALNLAQTQLEDIRAAGSLSSVDPCMQNSQTPIVGATTCCVSSSNAIGDQAPAGCSFGAKPSVLGEFNYYINVQTNHQPPITITTPSAPVIVNLTEYTITVKWPREGAPAGSYNDVQLFYRAAE